MKPGEHNTVQARILAYAEAIGWTFLSREVAGRRHGFDPALPPANCAKNRSLFFDDLLDARVREFNPRYLDAEGALLGHRPEASKVSSPPHCCRTTGGTPTAAKADEPTIKVAGAKLRSWPSSIKRLPTSNARPVRR